MLAALIFLVAATVAAALSCAYHRAREEGRALAAANYGLVLDVLNTAPVIFLWLSDSPAAIAGDMLGGWIGVFVGVHWYARRKVD